MAPFSWLGHYDRGWLRFDIVAGLTLWGLVVPQAIAYAGIAGLPPQAGLYVLVASLLVYAALGSSRHLVVGGTSATAALLASSVTTIAIATGDGGLDASSYYTYASAFVLVLGMVFLAASVARLGFITQFLSRPVMDGFVLGLATFVTVGQLDELLGLEPPDGNTVEKIIAVVRHLGDVNVATALVGIISVAILFLLPRLSKVAPAGLILLFVMIGASMLLDLEESHGVDVVGTIPAGLPSLEIPMLPLDTWLLMIIPAFGVLLVAFSEGLGVAREFADRHGYEVDPDQELRAYAASNLVSGVLGGMIAAGGMSASAVKEGAGARSQVSNLVAWFATIITVIALTPLFAPLPRAVLAALIIQALWHILSARKLQRIRQESRVEFWFGLATFIGVLLFDVFEGMVIGVLTSMLYVVYQTTRPHVSILGRSPGEFAAWSDIARRPDSVPVPGVLIVRPDGPMYYANAISYRMEVLSMIDDAAPKPHTVLIDSSSQYDLDLTSRDEVEKLINAIRARGIRVAVAHVHSPVQEIAESSRISSLIGDDLQFSTVDEAVEALTADDTTTRMS